MSRLDSFIRRLEAQRSCLALAVERSRHVPGVVLELGLGNGRTFDHLREIIARRLRHNLRRTVEKPDRADGIKIGLPLKIERAGRDGR